MSHPELVLDDLDSGGSRECLDACVVNGEDAVLELTVVLQWYDADSKRHAA